MGGTDHWYDPENIITGGAAGMKADADKQAANAEAQRNRDRAAMQAKVDAADKDTQMKFINAIRNSARGGGGNTLG